MKDYQPNQAPSFVKMAFTSLSAFIAAVTIFLIAPWYFMAGPPAGEDAYAGDTFSGVAIDLVDVALVVVGGGFIAAVAYLLVIEIFQKSTKR